MQIDNELHRATVLIVSGQATVAEALATCLTEGYGITAYPVCSPEELQRRMESRRRTGLILIDTAVDWSGAIGEGTDATPVALLTDEPSAEASAAVLEGRMRGALSKATPLRTAAAAIRLMLGGDVYLREVLPDPAGPAARGDGQPGLSGRRRAIGALIAAGRSNRQIETELSLSASLVASEIRFLLRHFNVRNRTELAIRWGSTA